MSGFAKSFLAFSTLVAIVMCPATSTLGAFGLAQLNSVERSQVLVESLFPEVQGRGLTVRLDLATGVDQRWQGANPVQLTIDEPGITRSSPVLRAHVLFNQANYEYVSFEGGLIPSAALDRVMARVQSSANLGQEEVAAALASEGARYGPDAEAALVRLIDLDRWSRALGRVALSDVQFVWRLPFEDVPPNERVISPTWVVGLKGTGVDGSTRCYRIFIEPISGRPTSLHGDQCD